MSLKEINTSLLAIETQFDELKQRYPALARESATARVDYELENARVLDEIAHEIVLQQADDPKFKMTVDEKSAQALLRTADLYRAYRETEAERDGTKMLIDVLQSQLMSTQTRTKLVLVEEGLITSQT